MYSGGEAGGIRGPMGAYGQYFPASSPGPPIQTTASNKGPDGANLFIFHIPNHFTNLDMYQLFTPYGNLLSVRIMVEKDSGRSRGFGFVSYDIPEAAAMAIKELNGFPVRGLLYLRVLIALCLYTDLALVSL
jgi:RNA recognition motif-containing protein